MISVLLVALMSAAPETAMNADDAYEAYENCVKKQTAQLVGAGETAEMTVKAAMSACEVEHIQAEMLLRQAAKYPGTADTVLATLDDRTKDEAVLQVMRARAKKHAIRK